MFTLEAPEGAAVELLAFSSDGALLAGGSPSAGYWVWNLPERRTIASSERYEGVHWLRFVPAKRLLAVAHEELVLLFEPGASSAPHIREPPPGPRAWNHAYQVTETTVTVACIIHRDRRSFLELRQWTVAGRPRYRSDARELYSNLRNLALPDGAGPMATYDGVSTIMLWPLSDVWWVMPMTSPSTVMVRGAPFIDILRVAPDGRSLAFHCSTGVRLLDIPTQRLRVLPKPSAKINAVVFSPDGRTLAIGVANGRVHLWDVESGRRKTTFRWDVGEIRSLAFSSDGMTLATGGSTGSVVVWDVPDFGTP